MISVATSGEVLATAAITPATDGTATRTLTVSGLPPAEPVTVVAQAAPSRAGPPWEPAPPAAVVACAPDSP